MKVSNLQMAVGRIENEVGQATREEAYMVIGELERIKAKAYAIYMKPESVVSVAPVEKGAEWITVKEAATHLRVSTHQVYVLCKLENGMPHRKVKGSYRFQIKQLDAWVDAGGLEGLGKESLP